MDFRNPYYLQIMARVKKNIKRILILGAAGPPGVNVINSLRLTKEKLYLVGTDANKFHLEWPDLDKYYNIPSYHEVGYKESIKKIIAKEKIDFVHAQPDQEVSALSAMRDELDVLVCLPKKEVIDILQDKLESAIIWHKAGLHNFKTLEVNNGKDLKNAAKKIGLPIWMRAKTGAGARGATLVENINTGVFWMKYWRARKSNWPFIVQPFLPGKEYAFQSLWFNGKLINSQGRERIEYIFPHISPSGRTGTSAVTKTVHNKKLNVAATKSILSVDPRPHGVYSVDLMEDKKGNITPTEINGGRFFATTFFYSKAGLNQPYHMIKLTFGEKLPPQKKYNFLEKDLYWIRHIDCPAVLVSEEKLKYKSAEIFK